jgi:hypothetical protein
MITIFKNIFEKEDARYIHIAAALERIKSGRSKKAILEIRDHATDKGKRNTLKKSLPCICFSGKFSRREDSNMISHSGFVVLDWDDVKDLGAKKTQIQNDDFTYAVWVSPSGNGLKALIRIPAEPINHRAYYLGLIEKFPELDTSNKNESRVCYESYDPELFVNENSLVWSKKGTESAPTQHKPLNVDSSNAYLKKSLENAFAKTKQMISEAEDGTRHEVLLKAATLLGGYLHYGSFQVHDIENALAAEFTARGCDKSYNYKKTIADGIKNGDRSPLYIDVPAPSHPVAVKNITPIPDAIISTPEDEREWLDMVFSNNVPQGLGMGSTDFDQHYRLKKQTLTGIFGMDNVGKTTFYLFMVICYAKKHGVNFLILCRENEAASVRQSLLELYLGHFAHQASDANKKKALIFCYKHFDIVKLSVDVDMENFIDVVEKQYNKKSYYACFVDPYNAVQHDQTPKKNYAFLDSLRRFQRRHDTSFHLSMHISTEKARNWVYGGKDMIDTFEMQSVSVAGQPKVPRKNFVEGGQPIANKLDDIIIVHRIQKLEELSQYTLVAIDKVKETRTGGDVTKEQPIMFKKQYGFISFVDSDGINPIVKPVVENIPLGTPADAFGGHIFDDDGLAF